MPRSSITSTATWPLRGRCRRWSAPPSTPWVEQVEHLARFESRLIVYLQHVTPFVDTKDFEFSGLATRISEDVAEAHEQLARTVQGLAAALSGVSDDVMKRWERYEGLRSSLASMQSTVQALRRELTGAPRAPARTCPHPAPAFSSDPLSSHKYVAFEDLFRGDRTLIRERQTDYLKLFMGRNDVLDVGCGRGEFLQLLREHGMTGRGVDLNHEMVAECVAAGLDVQESDASRISPPCPKGRSAVSSPRRSSSTSNQTTCCGSWTKPSA